MLRREELYRYVGNEEQLYSVRRVVIDEGTARGCALYQVTTAGGLEFDILPDSGLDIGRLKFRGVNINYMTKNGYDSPNRFLPIRDNFDHTFPGGMLYTCGLLSVGPQCEDTKGDGEFHPLHGRYHGQSARNLFAYVDGDSFIIGGEVRESEQWRHCLSLKRRYTIPVWGSEILIEDELTNLTPVPTEYAILYHVNFGWPFLSEKTELKLPTDRKTTPRTPHAAANIQAQCEFSAPIDGEDECVYFNEIFSEPTARLINQELGIEASLSWSLETLPRLSQWKSMRSGEYVLGLEPSTCYTMGRAEERVNGELRVLRPFETVKNFVRLAYAKIS